MQNLRRVLQVARNLTALLMVCATTALAQAISVSGLVTDAATSRPIIGAVVTLGAPPDARSTRTDELGGYNFANVPRQSYVLNVRGVGYLPLDQTVAVEREVRLNVALTRVAGLDTVRVRDGVLAIYGTVASEQLVPLANATVQILGPTVGQTTTDASGKFFYEVKTAGAYMVRGKSSGLSTATVSVTVPPKTRVEVALLLETAQTSGANALEMAYGDMRDRLMRRGLQSVMVPRGELVERGGGNRPLIPALMMSRTFASKGLRFTDVVCMFVDGIPQPGRSVNSIATQMVESAEAYGPDGDRSQNLMQRWPKSGNCGDTGLPRVSINPSGPPRPDIVKWLVIWLRH